MRYAPPGLCLNDFAVLPGDDGYTVLHLQGPWTDPFDAIKAETSYGRATSPDLVHWRPQGGAFGVGLPGRFDEHAVWTMHPVPHGNGTAMFYTGVTTLPSGGPLQSVGLARSDRADGTGWRRHGTEPVVRADPRWYRTGEGMAWRDPFVVRDDDGTGWVMVVCASDAALPFERGGCVGLATSDDLEHWQVHPPLLSPGDVDELECPVLERLEDGWLLLGSIGATRHIEAWTAPHLDGPWVRRGPLGPPLAYAPRVVTAPDGARVVLHTVPRRVGLQDSGATCRGMLAQPKALTRADDGAPRLTWWPGLDGWLDEPGEQAVLHAVGDVAVAGPTEVVLRTGVDGAPALTVRWADGRLGVQGPGEAVLASTELPDEPRRLRILTIGEYVELYADDAFVLVALSYTGSSCRWTVTRGGVTHTVPVRPVRLPDEHRDDASALWPGPH
ncbi:mucin-1 [Kitasatospora aureofaciens]|uniref:mucin-1 n=1 Tax=Kitasatospora aureofaciens TaxID=1894 RepID=UPI0037C604AB